MSAVDSRLVHQQLQQLRESFLECLPRDVERIESLWRKLQYVKWDGDVFSLLRRLVHNLRGSCGSHGLSGLDAVLARLDEELGGIDELGQGIGEQARARIGGLIKRLTFEGRDAGAAMLVPGTPPAVGQLARSARQQVRLLVLEDDPVQAESLQLRLSHQGFQVQVCATAAELMEAFAQRAPSLLLADIMLPDAPTGGIDVVARLRESGRLCCPVLFMSARGDLEARLAAVRAGGAGYFLKPLDIDAVSERIDDLMAARAQAFRVLIVEDEVELGSHYALILQKAGYQTRVLNRPQQLLDTLDAFRPDLVLMDLYLPECSGTELAEMIRQAPEYADLPVLFVSGETDPDLQNEALAHGGDGFLVKPILDRQLIAAVSARVQRARELLNRVQYFQQKDPLTGFLNQRVFAVRAGSLFDELAAAGRDASLLFIEMDQYRNLRDRLGLSSADLLLSDFAAVVARTLRKRVLLSARVGEASFAVLLADLPARDAEAAAARLCRAVSEETYQLQDQTLSLTASVGVAPLLPAHAGVEDWLRAAIAACDAAHAEGGNRVVLPPEEEDARAQEQAHERCAAELRAALASDRLECVFQPIASLKGEVVEQYDVLLRLRDREGREVLPARFLPVAEKEGLCGRIDAWVLRTVLDLLAQRQAGGHRSRFFVKLTPAALRDTGFADWLARELRERNVRPAGLVLEFPEQLLELALEDAVRLFGQLRRLGCGTAIEHFGRSIGSGSLLARLPVDYVKIDGGFLENLADTPANRDTIRSIQAQAAAQGALVIASFVEDPTALALLWQLGVHLIQGNFLQQPDPALNFDFQSELA